MLSKFTSLLFFFTLLFGLKTTAQDVVIEEVLYNPAPGVTKKIAFRNVSASPQNVSDWCLCNVPSYRQINSTSFNVLSGNPTALAPGELLILELPVGSSFTMNAADGEIALYHRTCGGYTTPSNMEDFVRWGMNAGSSREGVAVNAGLWTASDFVASAAVGEILIFDGTSDGGGNVSLSSDFTNTINGVLPVTLLDFSVEEEADRVLLKWVTAVEFNSECFKVERSFDGMRYEEIARVEAAGTTSRTTYYEYEDMEVFGDRTVYYRLKQMDFDGSLFCSSVEVINLSAPPKQPITISPNPIASNECLYIKLGSLEDRIYNNLRLVIYNALGEVVARKVEVDPIAAGDETFIDFPHLRSGTYFLSIFNNQEKIADQKIVVY